MRLYCGQQTTADVMTGVCRVLGVDKPITDLSLDLSMSRAQTVTLTIVLTEEEGQELARLLGTVTAEPDRTAEDPE
jgi:hypothetical protein